jgi:hypothetical protein
MGCGRARGYPHTTVSSPIGQEGVCVACSREIGSVDESNLVTFGGNQFIVCDEECAEKAEHLIEHSH